MSLALILAPTARAAEPPPVVSQVDLTRYAGLWYEIASFPNFFQRGCVATTAEYGLREGGVSVKNRCRKDTLDGEWKQSEGRARVVAPGKLKVSFFWPFEGDYWVLALDPDYRWALVGGPGRDYLWVLSRTPQMADATYAEITARAAALGYDLSQLRRTPQPGGPS
ncbi:lipocalin family protein [Niveibacterium umoris]|uniref:Outer membrane lipoprotein Blc n=1 Tax=Niveibacterium umoris TaxID=1193620 RepID=A0A840BNY4_9RHOO|nr:lipocalin family protein [Niveibacterium umoris]MBB4013372.1 apolipoprotein D and lipocalin family protein [Niveibacterium umoris]